MEPIHQITIQAVENGFVVRAGCRLFVSEKWDNVAEQLNAYFTGQETDFIKRQKDTNQAAIPQPADPQELPLRETIARG